MIPRFLNIQGIAGIAASLALTALLLVQKLETSHWKARSSEYEQLYRASETRLAVTLSNARAAAEQARAADRANAARVAAEQHAINERTANDYQTRLAAARARAGAVAVQLRLGAEPPTASGAGRNASMPQLPAAAGSAAQASRQDRLPAAPSSELGTGDALIATEQAIQLDELIKWVRAQSEVRANPD